MRPLICVALSRSILAGLIGLALAACAGSARPAPSPKRAALERPSASAAADALGDHYAALQRVADSVLAAQSPEDATPSELAQVTARNLAGRIRAISGDYGTLSVAMTAANYEQGVSLWMRLALAQAALELLQEDADRLGDDPATGPADVRDLADRLSGVLELGRVTGRVASRRFGAPPTSEARRAAPRPCGECGRSVLSQS